MIPIQIKKGREKMEKENRMYSWKMERVAGNKMGQQNQARLLARETRSKK